MPPVAAAYVTGTHLDNPEFVPVRPGTTEELLDRMRPEVGSSGLGRSVQRAPSSV